MRSALFVVIASEWGGAVPNVKGIEGHHEGKPRNDRRMLPLYWWLHRETPVSVHGGGGSRKFQQRFGIDFEAEITRLNRLYEEQKKSQ
jgi:hypothetical protein